MRRPASTPPPASYVRKLRGADGGKGPYRKLQEQPVARALKLDDTAATPSLKRGKSVGAKVVQWGVAAFGQRMLVAAMRIALVASLFLLSVYLSREVVTKPRIGTYSSISSKQIAMKYEAPTCGFNVSGTDVTFASGGSYEANPTGGYGGISQYLVLSNSRGGTDLKEVLSSIEADVYRIELIGAGREGSETRTLGVGRRGRAVYYQMQSYIMFLMPPFLLRAFTMGVLWPSLARILVNVQEDSCTQELMNGERAHMAAAAVTSQIMDAMDRDGGRVGYRHVTNGTEEWHGDPVDWQLIECLTYDEEPEGVASVRVSQLEWITCEQGGPNWSKPTIGFFALDAVLSAMFVLFVFVALRAPFLHFADEVADNELRDFHRDLDDGLFPKGTPQASMARAVFSQFAGEEDEDDDKGVNDLIRRPLMLVDFVVSDPVNCMFVGPVPLNYTYNDDRKWVPSKWSPFGDALASAFLHWLLITSVGMPLVLLAVLLGCKPVDEYEYAAAQCTERPAAMHILYFLWLKDLFGFLYCATHYLQLDGRRAAGAGACGALRAGVGMVTDLVTVPCRCIALALTGLTAFGSLAYVFNVVSWMVLTILLKPALAITVITLLAVPCAYVFFSFMTLLKMKDAILGSDQVKDTRAKLKRYGLRTQDILMTVFTGLMLIITLLCWVVLGFALFTNSLNNPASIVPALGMLGGAVQSGSKDVGAFQKKVQQQESQVTDRFTHNEDPNLARDAQEPAAVGETEEVEEVDAPAGEENV